MRFGTLCSGIEGAAVAWSHLGWESAFASEVDPFCCALIAERHPGVINLGDVTQIERIPSVDVLAAGTPCQSYSVQGKRAGLDDDRGQLALALPRLARWARPRWIVWENVPGVLSTNGGRDFGAFLGSLVQLGYGFAYRVLDAQYFGVAQRRRRVFVVGCCGSWQRAAAVLSDSPAGPEDARPVGEIRQERCVSRQVEPLLGYTGDTTPKHGVEVTPTLRAYQGGEGVGFANGKLAGRLTAEHWELLQGFPRGYTDIEGWKDTHRRRALGNAFCVPVLRWIGERIDVIEKDASRACV